MGVRKLVRPPKKASGTNVEEWQRSGCKIQFRLTDRESKALDAKARARDMLPNAYAQQVLRKHLDLPAEMALDPSFARLAQKK